LTLRIALLASGSGSLFGRALAAFADDRRVAFCGMIADGPDIDALAKGRAAGIPTAVVRRPDHPTREAFSAALRPHLDAWRPDVVLTTFNHILTEPVLGGPWSPHLYNVHYALLPAFAGLRPIDKALSHGARFAGVTLHAIDPTVDGGPPVLQGVVPVAVDETRTTLQHRLYSLAVPMMLGLIDWLADGRVRRGPGPRDVHVEGARYGTWPINPWPEHAAHLVPWDLAGAVRRS
jgi:phosphoribosylglycinamide formyltransferase-1